MKIKNIIIAIVAVVSLYTTTHAQNVDSLKALANSTASKKDVQQNLLPGLPLPILKIKQMDSTFYSTTQLEATKSLILVLFNPNCDHCVAFGKKMFSNMDKFSNTQFMFVSGEPTFGYLQGFANNINYTPNNNFKIGTDPEYVTTGLFAFEGIPQIMVFGTNKKLIDVYYKEASTDKLLKALARDGKMENLYEQKNAAIDASPVPVMDSAMVKPLPYKKLFKKRKKK